VYTVFIFESADLKKEKYFKTLMIS